MTGGSEGEGRWQAAEVDGSRHAEEARLRGPPRCTVSLAHARGQERANRRDAPCTRQQPPGLGVRVGCGGGGDWGAATDGSLFGATRCSRIVVLVAQLCEHDKNH